MKVKVLSHLLSEKPAVERYEYDRLVPHYEDLTQLWIFHNTIKSFTLMQIEGKKYEVVRTLKKGLITDKGSTPATRSHWYPASPFYYYHDTDFSLHNWKDFAINNDDGFRMANLVFEASIDFKIRETYSKGRINWIKKTYWLAKKRVWFRSVGSIAGQGYYVNAEPSRGYHDKYSSFKIRGI